MTLPSMCLYWLKITTKAKPVRQKDCNLTNNHWYNKEYHR